MPSLLQRPEGQIGGSYRKRGHFGELLLLMGSVLSLSVVLSKKKKRVFRVVVILISCSCPAGSYIGLAAAAAYMARSGVHMSPWHPTLPLIGALVGSRTISRGRDTGRCCRSNQVSGARQCWASGRNHGLSGSPSSTSHVSGRWGSLRRRVLLNRPWSSRYPGRASRTNVYLS